MTPLVRTLTLVTTLVVPVAARADEVLHEAVVTAR